MQRVTHDRPWPLHDVAATRAIERDAAASLPRHALMQRAGLAVARLALALAPHARGVWIACGPGNNGGDGLEAAIHLKASQRRVVVTWSGDESRMPADAAAALQRARLAGVNFASEPPADFDLAIDAMLGLGSTRPLQGPLAAWARIINGARSPVLAVDTPSGLAADTGTGVAVRASCTLSLLTLKPGLFTAGGRDHVGDLWFDELGGAPSHEPVAWLSGRSTPRPRVHASHKGSYGDVAVIGGAAGMAGAALLAGSAALHAGAGRVFVSLLGDPMPVDSHQPELMFRAWESLDLGAMSLACGCGGGAAMQDALPAVLARSRSLVLDADALNVIAHEPPLQHALRQRSVSGQVTVLTPHPLEAARLLGCSTTEIQSDRLVAARELSQRFACIVVLKGSGTIVASPANLPCINPTGNARLATGGTGDVLAGLIAARLAAATNTATATDDAFAATVSAVYDHGLAADRWPALHALTASGLARAI